jgi:hypothetical protein
MKTEKSVARGGKIRTESSDSVEKTVKGTNPRGGPDREMGGGPRDISHSITDGGKVAKI